MCVRLCGVVIFVDLLVVDVSYFVIVCVLLCVDNVGDGLFVFVTCVLCCSVLSCVVAGVALLELVFVCFVVVLLVCVLLLVCLCAFYFVLFVVLVCVVVVADVFVFVVFVLRLRLFFVCCCCFVCFAF